MKAMVGRDTVLYNSRFTSWYCNKPEKKDAEMCVSAGEDGHHREEDVVCKAKYVAMRACKGERQQGERAWKEREKKGNRERERAHTQV